MSTSAGKLMAKYLSCAIAIGTAVVMAGGGILLPVASPARADDAVAKQVDPQVCADSEKRWEYYGFAEAFPDGGTDKNQIVRQAPEGTDPDKQPTDSEDGLVIPHLLSSRREGVYTQNNIPGNRSFLAREKPGDPSTIQIMVRRRKVEYYNDFNIPEGLSLPSKIMVITSMNEKRDKWDAQPRVDYAHAVGFDAKHMVEGAADLYAELSDPNKLQARNVKGLIDVRAVSIPYGKNTGSTVNEYHDTDPGASYYNDNDWKIYHNLDDRGRLNFSTQNDPKGDIGWGSIGPIWMSDPMRIVSLKADQLGSEWYKTQDEFTIYWESKITGEGVYNFSFGQRWGKYETKARFKARVVARQKPETKVTLRGFYDSPYLDPRLFGTDPNQILPKGLKIIGHFKYNGKKIPGMLERRDGKCYQYPDGDIDFSGNTLKEVSDNLGQNAGRQFIVPRSFVESQGGKLNVGTPEKDNGVQFAFDIYNDDDFKQPADLEYRADKNVDRMRPGVMKGVDADGNQVPVKVMYYLMPGEWKPRGAMTFKIRLRPQVLTEKDEKYPLNPVGLSPYRNIIKWITFDDDKIGDELQQGKVIERDVIPGYLKVKCEVKDVQAKESNNGKWEDSHLDVWAPGYYYEDAAPWMIGDNQKVGIHQTGDENITLVDFACWAEQRNPATADERIVEIPVNGFVALDAETSDAQGGIPEALGIQADGTTEYYPIAGFSSCSGYSVDTARDPSKGGYPRDLPVKEALGGTSNTIPGMSPSSTVGQFFSGFTGMYFLNTGGRCGELNGERENGMIFGPSLMVTAPVDVRDEHNIANPRKNVRVVMRGNGKQAIGFGIVLAADTSNADYTNAMPPVYQYSSLSFQKGKSDQAGRVDWSQPKNYNANFYYYGARLGKKARPYDVNSDHRLKVRDGAHNDAMQRDLVKYRRVEDKEDTVQPKIKPLTSPNILTTGGYRGDVENKWLAGSELRYLTVTDDGGVLARKPVRKRLEVDVPCGQPYDPNNTGKRGVVRAWADFNGNGQFDPDEASTVATCRSQQGAIRGPIEMLNPTNEMPWTSTTVATVRFNYPSNHDLNGKRNVWMRIRAVDAIDKDVLTGPESGERRLAKAYTNTPTAVNPDPDAPLGGGSAYGSWAHSDSGETEDYLFDISTAPTANDDLFCVDANSKSVLVDVLNNDYAADDPRRPDPETLVFLANQTGVEISDRGKTARVAGEGTYTIADGKITFTPDPAVIKKAQGFADSDSQPLTSVAYAFSTLNGAEIYDRVSAAKATVTGSVAKQCTVLAKTAMWQDKTGSYAWDLAKLVKAENPKDDSSQWVRLDQRIKGSHSDSDKLELEYDITVKARERDAKIRAINGQVSLSNPLDQEVTVASIRLDVTSPDGRIPTSDLPTCQVSGDLSTLPKSSESKATVDVPFTCTPANGKELPAFGITVTPVVTLASGQTVNAIATDQFDPDRETGTVENGTVKLKDTIRDTRQPTTVKTSLDDLTVTMGDKSATLGSLLLSGSEVAAAGDNGVHLRMTVPAERSFTYPSDKDGTVTIINTAELCDASADAATGSCIYVPRIPKIEGETPGTVLPARAAVRVEPTSETAIVVRKVGGEDLTPLAGSQFAIYPDVNGAPGEKPVINALPARGSEQWSETAHEFDAAHLIPGVSYWLFEIKAPKGHQLLAQPVQFTINRDGKTITLGEGKSDFVTASIDNTQVGVITVRDVEDGWLPGSGGRSLIWLSVLGAVLGIAAWQVLRRSSKTQ